MKTKTSKQPKQAKPAVQLKDLKPKKDAKGGTDVNASDNDVIVGSTGAPGGHTR